jgi:hypothetical protein
MITDDLKIETWAMTVEEFEHCGKSASNRE